MASLVTPTGGGGRRPHPRLRGSDPGSPLPSCRDWYVNGNYLVILVSVTVILPLALMRQLGECDRARALGGDVGRMHWRGPPSLTAPPPTLCRLPGLLQRLLSQLHGVLPNCSESPSAGGGRGQVSLVNLC